MVWGGRWGWAWAGWAINLSDGYVGSSFLQMQCPLRTVSFRASVWENWVQMHDITALTPLNSSSLAIRDLGYRACPHAQYWLTHNGRLVQFEPLYTYQTTIDSGKFFSTLWLTFPLVSKVLFSLFPSDTSSEWPVTSISVHVWDCSYNLKDKIFSPAPHFFFLPTDTMTVNVFISIRIPFMIEALSKIYFKILLTSSSNASCMCVVNYFQLQSFMDWVAQTIKVSFSCGSEGRIKVSTWWVSG